jgi:outer membrane protein OmpA-like peptidoglycan-associated protein
LSTAGYGEERPVATNETPEGRRMNRPTTIKVLENEK